MNMERSTKQRSAVRLASGPVVVEALRPVSTVAADPSAYVRDIMQRDVVSVAPEACVARLEGLLSTRSTEALLVVGTSGALLGIVTKGDLLRRLVRLEAAPEGDITAAEVMTPVVFAARPEWPIAQAAALMSVKGVRCVPVVAPGRTEPVGLVTAEEVLRWLARRCGYPVPLEGLASSA